MAFPWGALISFGGSLIGANKAKQSGMAEASAIDRLREYLSGLAQPYLKAGEYGVSGLKNIISSYLMPRAGKESPILRGSHEQNLGSIAKGSQAEQRAAESFWGARGNVGRAIGEKFATRRRATEATNVENLRYGGAQEEFKDTTAGRLQAALGGMGELGTTGLGLATNAAQMGVQAAGVRSGAQQGYWEDLMTLLGTGYGMYRDDRRWKDWMALQNRKPTSPTASSTDQDWSVYYGGRYGR